MLTDGLLVLNVPQVLGNKYQSKLLEIIDARYLAFFIVYSLVNSHLAVVNISFFFFYLCTFSSELPDFLGGTCTCADRGGCMRSDKGPWNDPDILKVCFELYILGYISFLLFLILFIYFVISPFETMFLHGSNETLNCMQVLLSGEAECFRQIVTVSNSEGRVISCDKARMVLSTKSSYYVYPDVYALHM